jgi:formylglycine-generating enzyme required for sulfatase activity
VRGEVYPDAKFYNTLKNVMTSTPGARTLQYPKGSVKAKLAKESFKLNIGLVAGAIVLLLIFGIGYAALRMRSAQQTPEEPAVPMQQSATSAPVSNEFTSVPGAAATAQATEAPQVSNAGDDMVLVPAGEFTMGRKAVDEFAACQKFGSDCNVTWFTDEEPVHKVSVNAFYIDKYEVTNALYKQCVDQGACDPPQASNSSTHLNYYGNSEFDKYPVIYVTWNQAKAYCEWRGARLPTEAEWEKAARGTDGRMYPWGDNLDETFANFNYSVGDTTPVGSYEKGKSPYGAYDMAGNVWEWVNSQDRPYPYTPDDGRESPTGDDLRVARGGSWGFVGVSVSSSYRYGFEATSSNLDLGFRCARDANP